MIKVPWLYADGEQLSNRSLADNIAHVQALLSMASRRVNGYFEVPIVFGRVPSGTTRTVTIQGTGTTEYDLVAVELIVESESGDATSECTLTVSGGDDVSVTPVASSDVSAFARQNVTYTFGTDTPTFAVTGPSSGQFGQVTATMIFRHRTSKCEVLSTFMPKHGEDVTGLNAWFTATDARAALYEGPTRRWFSVHTDWSPASGALGQGPTGHQVGAVGYAATVDAIQLTWAGSGSNVRADYADDTGAYPGTSIAPGTTVDVLDQAPDGVATGYSGVYLVSASSSTPTSAVIVLYWSV